MAFSMSYVKEGSYCRSLWSCTLIVKIACSLRQQLMLYWISYPIRTGTSTSKIRTGEPRRPYTFSQKWLLPTARTWFIICINHFRSFKPLSSQLLRFFKKSVIEIQKIDDFWKFFSKKSNIEFDTSKWRDRWADYDYWRFFS